MVSRVPETNGRGPTLPGVIVIREFPTVVSRVR